MDNKRLYTPSTIKEILNRHGFTMTKALGQNFLIDGNTVRGIVQGSGVTKEDRVLEIGPGIGTLTEELALEAKSVLAVEKDQRLKPILEETMADYDNVEILFGDALKLDLKKEWKDRFGQDPVHIVANLPYYVTTPILGALFDLDLPLKSLTVMVQKEVAERMCGQEGTKDYGALTLFIRYHSDPEIIRQVPNSVFIPRPKVDSAVVHMLVKEPDPGIQREKFFRIVKAAFSKRRKTILNALSSYGFSISKAEIRKILEKSNIDSLRRGETLSLTEFLVLSINFPDEF